MKLNRDFYDRDARVVGEDLIGKILARRYGDTLIKLRIVEMNNLRYLFEHFDMEALDKATELILNANRVYVLGLRTSSTLSNYLGFYLDVILNNVKVLNNSGVNSLYEEIIRIKDNDLLIVISYSAVIL
jgi:DNA-binding MurR/RpiR family transcriptional regulator